MFDDIGTNVPSSTRLIWVRSPAMSRALVLNATYEPLGIVSRRRAAVLVLCDKAVSVVASDEVYRAERLVLEVPSVVRLRAYVKVPYRRLAPLNRRAVFARDGHRCQYCNGPAESIDHVLPRSRGGAHTWENVVAACKPCNLAKRDRLLSETSMRLRCNPSEPRGMNWLALGLPAVPPEWNEFFGAAAIPA